MKAPRYQVFVSSTFRDLQEERQAVLDAILEMNHFPAGMEIFPAATETQWDLIERIINETDYYVLIVGGRYGSTDENGVSYTEREYDLATKLGRPILAFLHADPDAIPRGKSEMDTKARKKLEAFRKKVENTHHRKYWKNSSELKARVIISLIWAIGSHPAVGWVRADGIDNTDLLKRLADLQERYDSVVNENRSLRDKILQESSAEDIACGEERITLGFTFRGQGNQSQGASIQLTWDEIFFGIGGYLVFPKEYDYFASALSNLILTSFLGTKEYNEIPFRSPVDEKQAQCLIGDSALDAITVQFLALGWIEPTSVSKHVTNVSSGLGGGGGYSFFVSGWKLTPAGLRRYTLRNAVKASSDSAAQKVDGA